VFLRFNNHNIRAVSASGDDVERTTADGKTSAVHFLSFPFSDKEKKEFLAMASDSAVVRIEIDHEKYPHGTKVSNKLIEQMKEDLQV